MTALALATPSPYTPPPSFRGDEMLLGHAVGALQDVKQLTQGCWIHRGCWGVFRKNARGGKRRGGGGVGCSWCPVAFGPLMMLEGIDCKKRSQDLASLLKKAQERQSWENRCRKGGAGGGRGSFARDAALWLQIKPRANNCPKTLQRFSQQQLMA